MEEQLRRYLNKSINSTTSPNLYRCGEHNLSDTIRNIFSFEHEERKIDIKLWQSITEAKFKGVICQ